VNVMDAIRGRRSIRFYSKERPSEGILQQLYEAVSWAPSWANTQCWELIVVRDRAIKMQIADTLSKGNPARQGVIDAPITMVFLGIKGKSGFMKGEPCTDKGDWYMFDIGLAVENLCLAAYSMGLGSVIVGYFDAARAGEILNVPRDREVVAVIPIGVPGKTPAAPKRKEVTEFVFHDKYGEP